MILHCLIYMQEMELPSYKGNMVEWWVKNEVESFICMPLISVPQIHRYVGKTGKHNGETPEKLLSSDEHSVQGNRKSSVYLSGEKKWKMRWSRGEK